MVKVAILLPSLARTGPIIAVEQIVKQLYPNINITVFYFDDIREVNFPCKTVRISFYSRFDFSEFTVLHTHMLRCDIYAYLNRKYIKPPIISTIHQYIDKNLTYSYNRIISLIFTFIWEKCLGAHDQLICINDHMGQYYTRRKINSNIICIYNGIDEVIPREVNREDRDLIMAAKNKYTLLMTIASLNKTKGLDQVINFLKANTRFAYAVIGEGKEEQHLKNLSAELNVKDRLLLLGYKNDATSYLQYADVYVMPSYSEGFGLSLAEAASSKLPLVCSNIDSFREMFTASEACFFELNNTDSLSNAIMHAVQNKKELSHNAYIKCKTKFMADISAQKYSEVYHQYM